MIIIEPVKKIVDLNCNSLLTWEISVAQEYGVVSTA